MEQTTNVGLVAKLAARYHVTPGQLLTVIGLSVFALVALVSIALIAILSSRGGDFVAGEVAPITLNPSGGSITPSANGTIVLRAGTGGAAVDGFQVFLDISGSLPANLTFTPTDLTSRGLKSIVSTLDTTTSGRLLRLLFITSDPTTPFTSTTPVDLGSFSFTAPASGQMVFTFDTSRTKITQHDTTANIAGIPAPTTYSFGQVTTTSSATTSSATTSSSTTSRTTATTTAVTTTAATSSQTTTATTSRTTAVTSSQTTTVPTTSRTTVATTTSSGVGQTSCVLADVDGNNFLDIVDFADFATKYNKTCSTNVATVVPNVGSQFVAGEVGDTGTTAGPDIIVGEQFTWEMPLQNVGTNNNAVDLDLSFTNARIISFVPNTGTGWLSAIGYCDAQKNVFTATRVCVAMAKATPFVEGETVGTITVRFDTAGVARFERTDNYSYSDGRVKTPFPGIIAELTVGTVGSSSTATSTASSSTFSITVSTPTSRSTTATSASQTTSALTSTSRTTSSVITTTSQQPSEPVCGYQDGNRDNQINIVDFSRFGRVYRKVGCVI